ncbi:MAG TPA: MASE1 domain-containing protein [Verrucomicrobiae bacterium]
MVSDRLLPHGVPATQGLARWLPPRPVMIGGLLVCLGYFVGAKLGFALTLHPRPISVMWPPNSILLAALLLAPVRYWGFLLLCALPAHLWVQMQGGIPVPMMLSWCVSNATEALIGAGLTRWTMGCPFQLRGRLNVAAFLLCGGLLGPFFSSFLDAGLVRLNNFGEGTYREIWRIRFFSNVLAALTIAPVILLWAGADYRAIRRANWKQILEVVLLAAGVVGVAYSVFLRDLTRISADPAFVYAPMPFLLWAAVRFGAIGAVTSVFVTALISIYGAAHGFGPFGTRSPEANALSLQIFLSITSVVLLFLCSVMTDLHQARDRFAKAFHSSPDAMFIARKSDGHIVEWNQSAEKLFGYARAHSVGATISDLKIFPDEEYVLPLLAANSPSVSDLEILVQSSKGEIRHTLLSAHSDEIAGVNCLILSLRDFTERRRLEEETWELNMRLITAKEEERKRIARELHDDLNQRLALLAIEVDLLNEQTEPGENSNSQQLESIGSQLRELTSEVDRFSNQLHPAQLERLGLVAAMRAVAEETEQRWSVTVHFRDRGHFPADVDPRLALCLYRVMQEALHNAVRHSDSREIEVRLNGEEDHIRLRIIDKGKGFDVKTALSASGLGLVSIRERVKQVFGALEINSKPGHGTEVDVTVPLLPKTSEPLKTSSRLASAPPPPAAERPSKEAEGPP